MAKGEINIKGVVNDIKNTSVYYPIYEGIVNGIHALENSKEGKISIKVIRSNQLGGLSGEKEDILGDIESFEISDNGVGFNLKNQKSFRTFKSDYKLELYGGKGFGRFFYLKFFEDVRFESIYLDNGIKKKIRFSFDINADDLISNKIESLADEDSETGTKLILKKLKKQYLTRLNTQSKKIDTLGRKLLEHLLMYFADDSFNCPEISIEDDNDKISLNSIISTGDNINVIYNKKIFINEKNNSNKKELGVKIFKIKYSTENNTINLCGHNRVVVEENLGKYIPDFNQKLKEIDGKKENNYSIKTYVFGKYLDDNVDTERESFNFIKDDEILREYINEKDIFDASINEIKKIYKDFLEEQKIVKVKKVKDFINGKAPWYSALYKDFDYSLIESSISVENLDMKFHELKYKKEKDTKIKVENFVKTSDFSNQEEVEDLVNSLDDLVKTELAHYVATRKFTLELLEKSLEWNEETNKYKSEDSLHTIIFPTRRDSEKIDYKDHNMWILDEKLSFSDYISSDSPLNGGTSERSDIMIFDKKIAFRGENICSNPITIFEFKKPGRDDFVNPSSKEDPIQQIIRYVNDVYDGKYKTPKGLEIEVAKNTPYYGYVVCTLTKKVKNWLDREKDFKVMPDGKGYFKWYGNNNLYIEVLDWTKVVNDSKMRNKIFFDKLKIN